MDKDASRTILLCSSNITDVGVQIDKGRADY